MATLPIPDTRARGLREVVQSLRNHYGPKPKRVDGRKIPSGPNHLCEVWWMVRDLVVDGCVWLREGVQELPKLLYVILWRSLLSAMILFAATWIAVFIKFHTKG